MLEVCYYLERRQPLLPWMLDVQRQGLIRWMWAPRVISALMVAATTKKKEKKKEFT